jgi:hypothetical protein
MGFQSAAAVLAVALFCVVVVLAYRVGVQLPNERRNSRRVIRKARRDMRRGKGVQS